MRVSSRERSPIANTIWQSIRLRKFGYDVNVRHNADCTDSGGGGRKLGVSPSGEEYIDWLAPWLRKFGFIHSRNVVSELVWDNIAHSCERA